MQDQQDEEVKVMLGDLPHTPEASRRAIVRGYIKGGSERSDGVFRRHIVSEGDDCDYPGSAIGAAEQAGRGYDRLPLLGLRLLRIVPTVRA